MVESGQKRARELLDRVYKEEGSYRKAGARLGLGASTIKGIRTAGRGAGAEVLEALAKAFPAEASGLVSVSPERAASAVPIPKPSQDARERAVRAYAELHPEVSQEAVELLAEWATLAELDPAPHDARWWLTQMEKAARIWGGEDVRIRGG